MAVAGRKNKHKAKACPGEFPQFLFALEKAHQYQPLGRYRSAPLVPKEFYLSIIFLKFVNAIRCNNHQIPFLMSVAHLLDNKDFLY